MISRRQAIPVLLISGFIVLPVLFLGHVRFYSSLSRLPEMGRETVHLTDIKGPAEVVFDGRGIPYIEARHEEDLWFAQGYVHARDRFFQMEMLRRAAEGTLAEVFGEMVVARDRQARMLRLGATARRQALDLSARERQILVSYSAGVNAALRQFEGWISPEIWVLGIEPERWEVTDTLSIVMLVQASMSSSMDREMRRSVELAQLGRERVEQLWGWSRQESRRWIPPVESPEGVAESAGAVFSRGAGSTAQWAIAPTRTESERPLLAAAPSFEVVSPGSWYAVGLRAPGLHATGVSIAGMPGVIMGHNQSVAWSYGPSYVDDQDVFVVTLDQDHSRELIDGQWIPIRTIAEEITVRWKKQPELLKVRMSRHGPLVQEGLTHALALSWSAYTGPSPIRAFLAGMRLESADAAADVWHGVGGSALSLVAADVDGHILHQIVGMRPNRQTGAGRLPAPGDQGRWAWDGLRDLPTSLRRVDPDRGFVASCGHDPFVEGDFPSRDAVPGDFDPPWRIRRIRQRLAAQEDWKVQDCFDLQRDVASGRAIAFLKALWPDFQRHQGFTANALLEWDGRMDADRTQPHLFVKLVLELQREIGFDEAVQARLDRTPITEERLLRLLAGGIDDRWWDDIGTALVEDRAAVVDRCLELLDTLREMPTWGDVHGITLRHPLAEVPLVGSLFRFVGNRSAYPLPGGADTIDANGWDRERPFDVVSIPSMRFVADVGDWDRSVLVLPTGQSGRPWSAYYRNRIQDWNQGAATELPFSREAIDLAAKSRLELRPE